MRRVANVVKIFSLFQCVLSCCTLSSLGHCTLQLCVSCEVFSRLWIPKSLFAFVVLLLYKVKHYFSDYMLIFYLCSMFALGFGGFCAFLCHVVLCNSIVFSVYKHMKPLPAVSETFCMWFDDSVLWGRDVQHAVTCSESPTGWMESGDYPAQPALVGQFVSCSV